MSGWKGFSRPAEQEKSDCPPLDSPFHPGNSPRKHVPMHGEDLALGGVLLAVITAAGTAWNTWTNRKQKQDQLTYDVKLTKLEADLAACSERHGEVEQRLRECQQEHKASEQDRSRLWAHVQRLQEFVQSPEKKHVEGKPTDVA